MTLDSLSPVSAAAVRCPPAGPSEDRAAALGALRARIRRLERGGRGTDAPETDARGARVAPLGLRALDDRLPGGGLALDGLHEIEGERAEWDDGAASGFCLALVARLLAAAPDGAPVLWATRWRDLHAPGVAGLGVDPGRLILARAAREADVLWTMEEGLRCPRLAAVVGEVDAPGLTAARRLQLAAGTGGVPAVLLRRRLRAARGAQTPSAAATRWRVAPEAGAGGRFLGRPRWRVELLRCRGAAPGAWSLEWDDAADGFALAAPLRDGPVAAGAAAPGRDAVAHRAAG